MTSRKLKPEHEYLAERLIAHVRNPRVAVSWGHIDRMPRCDHGRIFCRECERALAEVDR